MAETGSYLRLRFTLAAIGLLAGFVFWLLFVYLRDVVADQRLLMLLAIFAGTLLGGLLLMVGRIGWRAALRYGVAHALVVGLLAFWASFRFATAAGFMGSIHPLFAVFILVFMPLPFFMAQETSGRGWRDYEHLFDHAWSIIVRWLTAWLFAGLFWLVIFLSDQLLQLVGFYYLGDLTMSSMAIFSLTGLVIGLAIAVLDEMSSVVSIMRRLALQLFRLLLPLVAVVIAIFVVLVPVAGFDNVFRSFSAAGTMLIMAAAAVTLISSAIDATDGEATRSRLMLISVRGMVFLLPLITAIGVYAIWVRVGQYGWSPVRLSGAFIAVLLLLYALSYALVTLAGRNWRGAIRRINIWMALSIIALSLLWLTPVLNLERISANSQFSRFSDGRLNVRNLDIWSLGKDWGLAGQAVLARLRTLKGLPQETDLRQKLAGYDAGVSRWRYNRRQIETSAIDEIRALRPLLPVLPKGQKIPAGAFLKIPSATLPEIRKSCQRVLPDGRAGCAAVMGAYAPDGSGTIVFLFWRSNFRDRTSFASITRMRQEKAFRFRPGSSSLGQNLYQQSAEKVIGAVLDGGFKFVPARLNALEVYGKSLLPRE